jgi:hypothetical protein
VVPLGGQQGHVSAVEIRGADRLHRTFLGVKYNPLEAKSMTVTITCPHVGHRGAAYYWSRTSEARRC